MAANKIQTGICFQPEYPAQLCVREFEAENGEIPVDEDALYRK